MTVKVDEPRTSNWLNENGRKGISEWTRTMSYERNEIYIFFHGNGCYGFPISLWLKFDDSVLDSTYNWLALSPLHRSDNYTVNNTATSLWERQNEWERNPESVQFVCVRVVPLNWLICDRHITNSKCPKVWLETSTTWPYCHTCPLQEPWCNTLK